MPVRKRADKRRTAYLMADWETYLELGIDLFDELDRAGFTKDREPPGRELAREAWLALREKLLAKFGTDTWAEREFGGTAI